MCKGGCGNMGGVSSGYRGSDSVVCISSDMCGGNRGGVSSDSNGCSGNMVGGSNNGLMDSDVVLVNDGGLNNLVYGVDLVGLGNSIGLGNLNGVGFGNMLLNNDFSLNRDRDSNRDLNGVLVDSNFRFNSGHLGSDDRVGSDRSLDFGDGNGISGCGSLVGGCWGDGSISKGGSRDSRWGESNSALAGLSWLSDVSVGSSLGDLRVLSVVVSSLDSLGSYLDSPVSDNFMDSLGTGGSSDDMFSD